MSFIKKMKPEQNKSILLFDGVCNFCNSSVIFILKRDKKKSIHFASLQSECGEALLREHGEKIIKGKYETIIFIRNGRLFKKSRAIIEITSELGGMWKLFTIFKILPSFLTDFFYDLIARNRYRIFGKREACMVPSPEIKSRFLC